MERKAGSNELPFVGEHLLTKTGLFSHMASCSSRNNVMPLLSLLTFHHRFTRLGLAEACSIAQPRVNPLKFQYSTKNSQLGLQAYPPFCHAQMCSCLVPSPGHGGSWWHTGTPALPQGIATPGLGNGTFPLLWAGAPSWRMVDGKTQKAAHGAARGSITNGS